ncbi:MAG TPA: biotin/lipoate A/B protein ligase family protein [Spirochaetales bacterium]|nr:biotin/lipoate A/B protein ligase family protein [Spirochaetales bacterium]HPS15416.1 biotin/lipoate A/B protein ligase family protein [Spirochaetales bacterium]
MSYQFRLLQTGYADASFNMGLDMAILDAVASGQSLPTLRFYEWSPPAISLGYFQSVEEEINLEACKANGVDVVRRITGGGAVFHDAEVTYSIGIPEDHPLAAASIIESYRILCQGIIDGLRVLGIEAQFAPINDIVVGNKKISGNAQTRRKHCIFQHGTVLLAVNPELMFSLLKVPKEKSRGKMIEDIKAGVTSIEALKGQALRIETVQDALQQGFASALGLEYVDYNIRTQEMKSAKEYAANQFGNSEWTYRR